MIQIPSSPQEVFNTVAVHLLKQNKKSINGNGYCMYKDDFGRKCAAGIFLPEDSSTSFEGKIWDELVEARIVSEDNNLLICDLQCIHDCTQCDEWEKELKRIAVVHNLQFPECGDSQ